MENNQKPEWFELADNDQPANRPLKKKSTPMRGLTYVLAGALVIPMGAGFALLTHEDHSAIAAQTLNLVQDSPAAASSPQTLPVNSITMPTSSREDEDEDEGDDDYRAPVFSNSASAAPTSVTPVTTQPVQKSPAATASTSKAPVAIMPPGSSSASNEIILPPTKKTDGDDDDDDDHKGEKKNGKKSKDSDDDEEDED